MTFDLRKAYAEQLKQDYLKTGFKQGFEAGYAKAKEDFERPHGEWVYKKFDKKTGISDSYFCSCCDFPLTGIYKIYCSVCGADMRIKKEGEDNDSEGVNT